jgi:hypothetical protein
VPPEKLHDALPTDEVRLNVRRSDDFVDGEDYTVKAINPRQPNTLQIENSRGETTFVDHYDVELQSMKAPRDGVDPRDLPVNNRYLLWP